MDCINLKEQFGMKYEIGYEDRAFRGSACPWHYIILCRDGTICPNKGETLWADVTGRRGYQAMQELQSKYPDRIQVRREGSFVFHVRDLSMVAYALRARRK